MNFSLSKRWLFVLLITFAVIGNVCIYLLVFAAPAEGKLIVSFLDVGQGDAIFIESPTGVQMLIDGGPDRSVLRMLSKEMPPWDRSIDVLVETHPDKDHIGGLGDVLTRYRVSYFLESGVPDHTATAERVKDLARDEPGLTHRIVHRGMRLHLGGGAYADVLFPDTDQSAQKETNDGSVVLRVVYGNTSVMLTGDIGSPYEDHLVSLDSDSLKSDVLKAAHHGSRYSTGASWLSHVQPEVVVISAGKDNSYGHPHEEVLERASEADAQVVSTAQEGTVTFVSDGREIKDSNSSHFDTSSMVN